MSRRRCSSMRMTVGIVIAACALSACGGGGGGGSDDGNGGGRNPPPPPPPVGQLRFASITFGVGESAGTATATIERVDGSRGAVGVVVTSADSSALAGQDYASLSATVTFADGDTAPKTVALNIINDAVGEGEETLTLTLSNPTGGATLSQATCTVVIDDDDEPAAATLAIGYEVKRLAFSWGGALRATSYRFMRREQPDLQFVQLGADFPANATSTKLSIPVHLSQWGAASAQYRIDACNDGACAASNPVSAVRVGSALATGYVKASDTAAAARFGSAVAVSGNGKTVVVGAPFADGESGSVYVYTAPLPATAPAPPGPPLVPRPVRIAAPSAEAMHFGASVALDRTGDLLIVGAPFDSHRQSGVGVYPATPNSDSNHSGAVFVYRRIPGGWSAPVYIKASDVDAGEEFGSAVAVRGTVLVVGAPGQDSATDADDDVLNGAVDSGAAYLFSASSGNWVQSRRVLKASNIGAGDGFGASVALDSTSIVLVGAPLEDGGGTGIDPVDTDTKQDSGAAYRFAIDDSLIGAANPPPWPAPQRFKAINSGSGDRYGTSVAIGENGEVFAVGAPNEDGIELDVPNDAGNDVGAAYVYTMSAGAAPDVAYLKALHRHDGAQYGSTVALDAAGGILAVGSPHEAIDEIGVDGTGAALAAVDAGSVDVLERRQGSAWSSPGAAAPLRHYIKANNTAAGDSFGSAVSLSSDGTVLMVGAPQEDGNGRNIDGSNNPADDSRPDAGAAYLY